MDKKIKISTTIYMLDTIEIIGLNNMPGLASDIKSKVELMAIQFHDKIATKGLFRLMAHELDVYMKTEISTRSKCRFEDFDIKNMVATFNFSFE